MTFKQKLGFVALMFMMAFALQPQAQASMWDGTSISAGAVASTAGGYSGSVMVGYTLGSLTAQAYHNASQNTGADLVLNVGNVIVGAGGIHGQTGVVGVVGYKLGNFKMLGHVYDGKNDGARYGANVGAYYTWNLK